MVRNWIIVSGLAFLGIGGGLIVAKKVATMNIPVLSTIGNGAVSFWRLAE